MVWSHLPSALLFSAMAFQSPAFEFQRWLNFSNFYNFFYRHKYYVCYKGSSAKMTQDEQWLPMGRLLKTCLLCERQHLLSPVKTCQEAIYKQYVCNVMKTKQKNLSVTWLERLHSINVFMVLPKFLFLLSIAYTFLKPFHRDWFCYVNKNQHFGLVQVDGFLCLFSVVAVYRRMVARVRTASPRQASCRGLPRCAHTPPSARAPLAGRVARRSAAPSRAGHGLHASTWKPLGSLSPCARGTLRQLLLQNAGGWLQVLNPALKPVWTVWAEVGRPLCSNKLLVYMKKMFLSTL